MDSKDVRSTNIRKSEKKIRLKVRKESDEDSGSEGVALIGYNRETSISLEKDVDSSL
jgi:hypothetical protein